MHAVSIEGLRVRRRGREVLHDLTLDIPAGSVTGLLGPSGCGKSTLMRAIVGVQILHSGRISVLGMPAGSRALRGRIGYATQLPAVYSDLTVAENLRYFASILGAAGTEPDRIMADLQLDGERHVQVGRLSGGQLSRASLAVALLGDPKLLILDEPTVGVDPVLREHLWNLFHHLAEDRGATLLVSSHVMEEATRCARIVLMRDGAILAYDSPSALCARTGTASLEAAFLELVRGGPASGQHA